MGVLYKEIIDFVLYGSHKAYPASAVNITTIPKFLVICFVMGFIKNCCVFEYVHAPCTRERGLEMRTML